MSIWDNLSAGLGVLLQVGELIAMIAAIVWFVKRLTLLDADIRDRATHEPRVEALPGVGFVVMAAEPCGLFRWRCETRVHRLSQPPPESQIGVAAYTVNGKPAGNVIRADPRRDHAIEVLLQTRAHADYGDRSDRLIAANKFSGSTDTWESGTRYLEERYSAFAKLGVGTFCGPDHPTVTHLLRVVMGAPLPRPDGNGRVGG